MVITTLEEKENRKFYVPIREGNRGGWSLFEWQSVREMPYRDRQMYLGNSAVIGVLDKGGKWRKRDWYAKTGKVYGHPSNMSEQEKAIQRDQERINAALGRTQIEDEEKLTEEEMKTILSKIKNKDGEVATSKESVGLGFDKSRVQIRAAPQLHQPVTDNLPAINELDDLSQHSSKSKRKKKSKKGKKEKKIRKEKGRKGRDYSRSRSPSESRHCKRLHKKSKK